MRSDSTSESELRVVRHPGSCALIVLDGDQIVLVRQWRAGAGRETTEVPQEKLQPGETPEQAAHRGLAEECGLTVSTWTDHGSFWAVPVYSTHHVRVLSGSVTGTTDRRTSEEHLLVERRPLSGVGGALDDAISIAALALVGRIPPT